MFNSESVIALDRKYQHMNNLNMVPCTCQGLAFASSKLIAQPIVISTQS